MPEARRNHDLGFQKSSEQEYKTITEEFVVNCKISLTENHLTNKSLCGHVGKGEIKNTQNPVL